MTLQAPCSLVSNPVIVVLALPVLILISNEANNLLLNLSRSPFKVNSFSSSSRVTLTTLPASSVSTTTLQVE